MHRVETPIQRRYSQRLETVRKDVDRMFGILQSRLEILCRDMRYWDLELIICISETCFILLNLIVPMQQNGEICDVAAGTDIFMELCEQ